MTTIEFWAGQKKVGELPESAYADMLSKVRSDRMVKFETACSYLSALLHGVSAFLIRWFFTFWVVLTAGLFAGGASGLGAAIAEFQHGDPAVLGARLIQSLGLIVSISGILAFTLCALSLPRVKWNDPRAELVKRALQRQFGVPDCSKWQVVRVEQSNPWDGEAAA